MRACACVRYWLSDRALYFCEMNAGGDTTLDPIDLTQKNAGRTCSRTEATTDGGVAEGCVCSGGGRVPPLCVWAKWTDRATSVCVDRSCVCCVCVWDDRPSVRPLCVSTDRAASVCVDRSCDFCVCGPIVRLLCVCTDRASSVCVDRSCDLCVCAPIVRLLCVWFGPIM